MNPNLVVEILYAFLIYLAMLVFVVGLVYRIGLYLRTPIPHSIPIPSRSGSFLNRLRKFAGELIFFATLFKADKWTWVFSWLFHFGLLIILLKHLFLVTDAQWAWLIWLQEVGSYAATITLVGLTGLCLRRCLVDRLRYISAPSDYLMLAMLVLLSASGLLMKLYWPTDIVAVKQFLSGLMVLRVHPLPGDAIFLFHVSMVVLLLLIFPFSKLLHVPGLFINPTISLFGASATKPYDRVSKHNRIK